MQIRVFLFLIFAIPALVTASQQATNCILGCKCQEEISSTKKLKIQDCDSPLVLTKSALADISKKITSVFLKNVVVKRIEHDAFNGFGDLEYIIIEDVNIGAIDPTTFDLPELGTISFTRTAFGEVPNLSSTYLEELIFNDCKLTQVPKLENLPALIFLNLANNKIKDIDEATFATAVNLEEVNFSNNSISKLPINLFVNSGDFNTLNVDFNPFEIFQLNLTSDLELLSLRSCKLTIFDRNSAKTLESLTSLTLSGNEISLLPIDAFDVMKDLNYIDLSNNKLVELDDDIFQENSKLDKIILDNNHFETLPNFQTKETSFQTNHFSCRNCGIKSIGNAFENMKNLETLDLSNNKIKTIEGAFTEMLALRELYLSRNNITTIGANSFGTHNTLEVLNLSHNPLRPLDPVVFADIMSLKTLDISNSSLTKLWTNHNAIILSLEQLLIGGNNITVISSEDLQVAPKLKILDLKNNPLKCTPELHDLIEYMLNKPIFPIDKIDMLKTHESVMIPINNGIKEELSWKQLGLLCGFDDDSQLEKNDSEEPLDDNHYYTDDSEDEDDIDEDDDIDDDDDDDNDDDDDDDDDDEKDNLLVVDASILSERNMSLAKASWILSITSVFILTALVVLTVAVAITLLILKRNKSFNVHNGNLPRFKIPLWNTAPGQKRHSGSVYKPLSEDLSGPRTPIINRYEFKQTPQVHNSLP